MVVVESPLELDRDDNNALGHVDLLVVLDQSKFSAIEENKDRNRVVNRYKRETSLISGFKSAKRNLLQRIEKLETQNFIIIKKLLNQCRDALKKIKQ